MRAVPSTRQRGDGMETWASLMTQICYKVLVQPNEIWNHYGGQRDYQLRTV
jgi:hypothetical protein